MAPNPYGRGERTRPDTSRHHGRDFTRQGSLVRVQYRPLGTRNGEKVCQLTAVGTRTSIKVFASYGPLTISYAAIASELATNGVSVSDITGGGVASYQIYPDASTTIGTCGYSVTLANLTPPPTTTIPAEEPATPAFTG